MKVSKEKKIEIRKKIIESAVDIISEKGFRSATMREISSRAGLGSATIYNYFPTKEKILFGYFEDRQVELGTILCDIPEFDQFNLKEKLQSQLESLLELYLGEREFVHEAFKLMFDSPLRTVSEFAPIKKSFLDQSRKIFEEAKEKNEMEELPAMDFMMNLYWDYSIIITFYWLRDDSENFTNTSQVIDMTLDIVTGVIKSGAIPRVMDLASFLFRSHIYSSLEIFHKLISGKDKMKDFFKESYSESKYKDKGNERSGQDT